MERWSECIDSFLYGLVVGLAVSIVISVSSVIIQEYNNDVYIESLQEKNAEEYQDTLRALEGF